MKAPKMVAKGQRLMAERIKQLARDNNVPVIEDKPLARALFSRPIGAEVPAHLYRAVARLLVLVHQARFRGRGQQAAGQAGAQGWTASQARAAASGLASRPWWASTDTAADVAAGGADTAAATRLYGGTADSAPAAPADADAPADSPDAWLDDAALKDGDVDEDALATALADDELADMTSEEMAQLEVGLDGTTDSTDSTPIDEEPAR
jgi:type III secretion system FlhB-like substrate exporter